MQPETERAHIRISHCIEKNWLEFEVLFLHQLHHIIQRACFTCARMAAEIHETRARISNVFLKEFPDLVMLIFAVEDFHLLGRAFSTQISFMGTVELIQYCLHCP